MTFRPVSIKSWSSVLLGLTECCLDFVCTSIRATILHGWNIFLHSGSKTGRLYPFSLPLSTYSLVSPKPQKNALQAPFTFFASLFRTELVQFQTTALYSVFNTALLECSMYVVEICFNCAVGKDYPGLLSHTLTFSLYNTFFLFWTSDS